MSVVVRMEMPKWCWDCPCVNGEYGYCQADKEERQIEDPNERPSWCPIIAASPWHRVEEEPKEEHRTYLVYTDTGYMCSCRWTNNVYGLGESDRWGWCFADIPQFQEVVYWMPIEPPKEEEHGN